jgi:hypothetical protein
MSGLMLREKLLTSPQDSAVSAVARTVTLAALRRLDGERRAAVVRFLHEARLLEELEDKASIIVLRGADLSGADLRRAELPGDGSLT